jgi:ribokinase
LIRRDEPLALLRADHDPVKDVDLSGGDDVVDPADSLAIGRVDGDAAFEHLIGDRQPLVHKCADYRQVRRRAWATPGIWIPARWSTIPVPMTRIGVVGHIEWVDFIPVQRFPRQGEVVHADGVFARAAGGGSVVACVLAEAGAEVDFFTALGSDATGRAAAAELEQRGVRVHVAWRRRPTRRAVTLLEPTGERTIVTLSARLEPLGSDRLEWERLRGADAAYVTAGDCAALAQARMARVLVASPRARGALGEGDGPSIDALVFSQRDRDECEWARRIAPRARLLVATEGAHGGRWWGESRGTWAAAPLPDKSRDAYGCGDSFAAGFTLALASGESVAAAAELGARCGALCLTRAGAP